MSNQDKVILQNLRSADVISGSTAEITHHFNGNTQPKLPEASTLELGEIALNIAKGYEVIAIKNIEGEIVYLPFNVAIRLLTVENDLNEFKDYTSDSLSGLSASTIQIYESLEDFRVEITSLLNDEVSRLEGKIDTLSGSTESVISAILDELISISANTDYKFEEVEDEIAELSAKTGDGFDVVNEKVEALSSETRDNLSSLSGSITSLSATTNDAISGLDEKINEISGKTVGGYDELDQKIDSLSATVENNISSLSEDIQSLSSETKDTLSEFEDKIDELSGKTGDGFDVVNEKVEELSAQTDEKLSALSGTIQTISADTQNSLSDFQEQISEISGKTVGGYDLLNEKIDALSSDTQEKLGVLDQKIIDERTYVDDKVSTLSADTDNKIEHLADYCASAYTELYQGIEDVELVHAAAFAQINSELGFNENAEYKPESLELSDKNVTEAIDYLYSGYEELLTYIDHERTAYFMRSITYENLRTLIIQKKLLNGLLYRITNYQATVSASLENVSTRLPVVESDTYTNNGFDVIVRAISSNQLDENAILTMSRDSLYFEDCSIESWQVKYSFKNDKSRFEWANEQGFGVIYYMKDNYGNEASYDFKNIKFKVGNEYKFTFHNPSNNMDASILGLAMHNTIKPTYVPNYFNQSILKLNRNIFIGDGNYGNFLDIGVENLIINGNATCCKINKTRSNFTIDGPIENEVIGYVHIHRIID